MGFFTDIWSQFNKLILNSVFHGITSKNTILIQFRGRKSGLEYTTPVNYTQQGDTVRITSLPDRNWWKNLKHNPQVVITLRGKKISGISEVFEEQEAVARELGFFLEPAPKMARYFKVSLKPDGSFNEQDLFNAAKNQVIIKVQLINPEPSTD